MSDTIIRARALLAAATQGPWAHERSHRSVAIRAAAPELLAALCDELEASARRNMNQVGLIDAWAAKCERLEAERDALRAEVERLRARKAEVCDCVHGADMIGESFVYVDDDCPKCGGSGGVIVEGEQ